MNSFSRQIDDDRPASVHLLDSMQENLRDMEGAIDLAREILASTGSRLAELRSQMAQMSAAVERGAVQQRTPSDDDDVSIERVLVTHKRSKPSSSESDVIGQPEEEEEEEKAAVSSSKRLRTHSDPEIQIEQITSQVDRKLARLLVDQLKAFWSSMTDCQAEAVALAVYKTKGVLSPTDFLAFLSMSSEVDDPLQLARVSFTTKTSALYYQLMTFSIHLRNVHGEFQMESGFEKALRRLIRDCHMSRPEGERIQSRKK